jgi:hypothetical protein
MGVPSQQAQLMLNHITTKVIGDRLRRVGIRGLPGREEVRATLPPTTHLALCFVRSFKMRTAIWGCDVV